MSKLVSYNPATLEEVGSVDITPVEELPAIVERCRKAQKIWSGYKPKERIEFFKKLTVLIADHSEEIGHLVHEETGKPKAEAINMESYVSASYSKYCEIWLKKFKFEKKVPLTPVNGMLTCIGRSSRIIYKPLGVAVSISSNNFPVCIPFTEAATAVATGNGIIIKPSPDTPLCGELVASLFKDAGFPEDLVMCVNGPNVGETLTGCDYIDRILFTGGTKTGKCIISSAMKNLTPTSLELGGCDPMIILKDADLERSIDGGVWGAFTNAGQVCVGFQKILVHRSLYDDFVDGFIKSVKSLKIGFDWDDPNISVGPMISEAAIDLMDKYVSMTTDAGGRILTGGKRIPGKGYFYEPTVVVDLPINSEIFDTEVFGPYVTITPFDTEEEAVKIANDSKYALGGSVWTKDYKHGREIGRQLHSGIVNINNGMYNYGMPTTPWGGYKSSGFGKTHGDAGFSSMMQIQHLHTDKGKFEVDPWWFPFTKEGTELQAKMTKGFFGSKKHSISILLHAMPLLKKKR